MQNPQSPLTAFRSLRACEHRSFFKGDKPVLRLPLLVGKFSLGGGEEAMVVVRRCLCLMEIIVRRCPQEKAGWILRGKF